MLTINIIGAGKVGMSLGYFIVQHQIANIKNICNNSLDGAIQAKNFIGQGTAIASLDLIEDADIFLITTPDDKITAICAELVQYKKLKKDNIVIHCSGVLSSDALSTAKKQGCQVVSMHPAASFMAPITDLNFYQNIYIALEGDLSAIKLIQNILIQFKIKSLVINTKKVEYHLSTVVVSNFLVGLFHEAETLLSKALITIEDQEQARILLLSLLSTVVENLKTSTTQSSLTGPIARGDDATIKKHLNTLLSISAHDPNPPLLEIYKNISLAILRFSSNDEVVKNRIEKIINETTK